MPIKDKYGIRFQELTGRVVFSDTDVEAGVWMQSFDAEAHHGRGEAAWTRVPREAMAFDSMEDAIAFYRTTPKTRPMREDGRPNRPLTAFTVSIEKLGDASDVPTG